MNQFMELALARKSVRSFAPAGIPDEVRRDIIAATLRAPTAGNMMLYSILEIDDPELKGKLAVTCDNQPFIATAPWVLVFLADFQRWMDYYTWSGVPEMCARGGAGVCTPAEADLFLACSDALIAAQTSVLAAESFGLGSCYIGDVMENYERHRELLALPSYVFPIAMVVYGYPTEQQKARKQPERLDPRYVVFRDTYRRLSGEDHAAMYKDRSLNPSAPAEADNFGKQTYLRKTATGYSAEMRRSVKEMLKNWR